MLSTEISPFPGARVVTGLRVRARAARRVALIALSGSIALPAAVQMLAERAATREETLQLAVLALLVFLGSLPALVATQAVWGARMRTVRRHERALYATASGAPARTLSRLGVAACWVVTLLLGYTVPRPFHESGLYGVAATLTGAVETLTLAGYAAGVFFAAWWARGALSALGRLAHAGPSPGDPWDPGRSAGTGKATQPFPVATPYRMRRTLLRATRAARGPAVLWGASALAVTALLGARAHLWEPDTGTVYALLATALVCGLVTGE
ncbi:hypothetical protein [Nonomuraea typhae]|uniref:hypothetical protein n=1 Tax=Nonomuraea typhae TaxID=2603600 RepID=UPI0012FAFB26|nr:hypothetical protein [Nonomuraea typhae]